MNALSVFPILLLTPALLLAQSPRSLRPDILVTDSLNVGGHSEWLLELNSGEHARVSVCQTKIDVAARLTGDDGTPPVEQDEYDIGNDCEELSWTASQSSRWHVSVRPVKAGAKGQYTIKFRIRRATDADHATWEAVVANARVRLAVTTGAFQSLDRLISDSLTLNERRFSDDREGWARHLNETAAFLEDHALTGLAMPIMEHAIEVMESAAAADTNGLARAHHSLGAMREKLRLLSKAQESFSRAVDLWQRRGMASLRELAVDLNRLATVLVELGLYEEAGSNFELSLQTFRRMSAVDTLELARAINNLGSHFVRLARFAEAESLFKEALAKKEGVLGLKDERLSTEVNNLAEVYRRLGRLDEAERLYQRLIVLLADVPEKRRLVTAIGNLALLRADQGQIAEALQAFEHSLAVTSDERGDQLMRAWVRNNRAEVLFSLGRYSEADADARAALEIRRRALPPAAVEIADSLSTLAKVMRANGAFEKAVAFYKEAVGIRRAVLGALHPDVAITLNDLATTHMELAHFDVAHLLLVEAIDIYRHTLPPEGHPWLTAAITNKGIVLKELGQASEAESLLLRSLREREAVVGESTLELGATLNALATLYEDQGRFRDALVLEQRALALAEKFLPPSHPQIAGTLQNMGSIEESQGRLDAAEQFYRRSAKMLEGTPAAKHPNRASVLDHIAHLVLLKGAIDEAADLYRQSADIRAETLAPDHPDNALSAEHSAGIAFVRHQDADAETWLRKALSIREAAYGLQHPTVSGTLASLAILLDQMGRNAESVTYVDRAVSILDGAAVEPGRRATLYALRAHQLERNGNSEAARVTLRQAIAVAETLRQNVGGSEETQAAFFTGYAEIYHRMVALEVMTGHLDAAVQHSEARRARVLADQLLSDRANWREGIPAGLRATLQAREARAKARLASAQRRLRAVDANTLPVAVEHVHAAEQEFRTVYEEIRNASPRWDVHAPVDLPPLSTLIRRVAPAGAAVLLYDLGEDDGVAFWLSSSGPKAYRLEIDERAAKTLGIRPGPLTGPIAASLLTGRDNAGKGGIVELLASPRRGVRRVGSSDIALPDQLAALWQVLIPSDIRRELLAMKDVVVVPDGALTLLPFEALVVERRSGEISYWLDRGPVIQYAPSLASLDAISRRKRPNEVSASDTPFLSLSGVIYDSLSSNGGMWPPLAASVTESNAFVRAAKPARVQLLQQRMATESAVRRAAPGKRIVHLATHAMPPDTSSGLDGGIVLAVGRNERSSIDDDGMLQLHELYELPLKAAWLTVLSACETNVGRPVAGEGVFALSRAALVAGSYSVIASQWSVDDRSTGQLFTSFFTATLPRKPTGDLTIARALRDSRRMIRKTKAWSDPYYWAPFVFIGPTLPTSDLRQ